MAAMVTVAMNMEAHMLAITVGESLLLYGTCCVHTATYSGAEVQWCTVLNVSNGDKTRRMMYDVTKHNA